MAKKISIKTQHEKDFVNTFEKIAYRYDPRTVWTDFVNMVACEISNVVDLEMKEERGKSYAATVSKYSKGDMDLFAQLEATLVTALDDNPAQDFLGKLYMLLGLGVSARAQIFTPWDVATVVSRLPLSPPGLLETLEEKGFVSIFDPACGAGCILLAIASEFVVYTKGGDFHKGLLLVGQDIDRTAAQMCYIQMSLIGCAGYVIVGDTLTHPPTGDVLLPRFAEDTDAWITPWFFTEPWVSRVEARLVELANQVEKVTLGEKSETIAEAVD